MYLDYVVDYLTLDAYTKLSDSVHVAYLYHNQNTQFVKFKQ